jgi:hypothetical protein
VSYLIAQHGINAIVHFAASTVVPESVARPMASTNLRSGGASATLNLRLRARLFGPRNHRGCKAVLGSIFAAEPRPHRTGDPAGVVDRQPAIAPAIVVSPVYGNLEIVGYVPPSERKLAIQ